MLPNAKGVVLIVALDAKVNVMVPANIHVTPLVLMGASTAV